MGGGAGGGAGAAAAAPANLTLSPTTFVVPPYSRMPFAFYVGGYAVIGLVVASMTFVRTFSAALFCLKAAKSLHSKLVGRVLRAPLSFFDTTPIGRIISRFSKDMHSIDHELLDQADMFVFMIAFLLATLGTIIAATPWFAVGMVPLMSVYVYFVRFFMPVARECKRLSIARSPVFAHYSETLGGIPTIRAYGAQRRFISANLRLVDTLNEAYYVNKIADRWLSARLECVGASVVFLAAILAVASVVATRSTGQPVDAVMIGLYGTSLVGASILASSPLSCAVRALEASFTSVERVVYYIKNIAQERPAESAKPPPADWPHAGSIEITNLKMKYRDDTPVVLGADGVGQGRPARRSWGALARASRACCSRCLGWSSRCPRRWRTTRTTASKPSIAIDGIDIESIGLHELRRSRSSRSRPRSSAAPRSTSTPSTSTPTSRSGMRSTSAR